MQFQFPFNKLVIHQTASKYTPWPFKLTPSRLSFWRVLCDNYIMAVIDHEMLILYLQSGFTEVIISFSGDERPYEITKINS